MILDDLIKEIQTLQKAHKILELVWIEIDPNSGQFRYAKKNAVSEELLRQLRDYFDFDDSE